MVPAPNLSEPIAFGRFRLLPNRRELLSGTESIKLGGRAFDLLMVLIEMPGAVVAKATPKDYRIALGGIALNFVGGDSGAARFRPDSLDDRHISDSRTVHGG
jgi:hypothetical protein